MKYLSLFSGIEAVSQAWESLGFEALAFSQFDPDHNYKNSQDFASAVLAHHYPSVPNLGDVTKFKEWDDYEPDIIVGGSPCQAFSIAGMRKGMDDPRGNLTLTYLATIERYKPRWFVWENVPGVLSSNEGRDFGSFLAGIQKLGYGFAYRVLDAQYFGVPQRRRRVFVVGHITDYRRAAAVLFDSKSLSGNHKKSRGQRPKDTSQLANCLTASSGNRQDPSTETYVIAGNTIDREPEHGGNGLGIDNSSITPTLTANDKHAICANTSPTLTCEPPFSRTGSSNVETEAIVAFKVRGGCEGGGKGYLGDNKTAFTLSTHQDQHLYDNYATRRLTPIECERLQGFPDNYTQITWNNKPAQECPDGLRYKVIGNSMAVPVMKWIGERIKMADEL
ncbi:DNA cytosine methyltransferase [Thiomicrorhabdus lithotrophica]|uniref:Cytosine-specific methyltransferase n=1 Tax=Thiomicrorhabdus lithotrophica TaxID=2949997 RepID=A0ABY8C891_9GAMM|nr:DNA (cytosine-5-)-methyltransferase [Thiomicrorhabdus lithotrophica]WEJ62186.1 DNA (cytosine-5-)-methyltransferase [Thiomicrorhabdus lithotrophica]